MKTITEFSLEAGLKPSKDALKFLERFAALVREDEREVCAKVCEKRLMMYPIKDDINSAYQLAINRCAAAIRARGAK